LAHERPRGGQRSGSVRAMLRSITMRDVLNWSNLLGGAIGGVASWLFVDFVARPIRRFRQMQAEIIERVHYFDNLPTHDRGADLGDDGERAAEAMNTLRQLGARMLSFAATETTATWLMGRGMPCHW
jgi:hypothetical protein